MSEVATVDKERELLVEKRRASWGQLGVDILEHQFAFQARAQALIAKIKHPNKFEEIPACEALYKELRSGQATLEKDRKEDTSRLDYVSTQLMTAEKSLNDPLKGMYDAIVDKKKEQADVLAIKAAKDEEVRKFIETIKTRLSQHEFQSRSKISTDITAIYNTALETGILPTEINDYIQGKIKKFSMLDFELTTPTQFKVKHILPEEIDQLLEEHWKTNPYAYYNIFVKDLQEKFSDYEVAFRNKEAALELSKKQAAEAAETLKVNQQNEETAIKLQATATPVMHAGPAVKPLKKSFEVDMPETLDNAALILSGFFANLALCEKKTTVEKWFNFSAGHAAKALAKVKYDDNDFQPEGIVWKEVSKL